MAIPSTSRKHQLPLGFARSLHSTSNSCSGAACSPTCWTRAALGLNSTSFPCIRSDSRYDSHSLVRLSCDNIIYQSISRSRPITRRGHFLGVGWLFVMRTEPETFEPFVLSPPQVNKEFGYGTWEVTCPQCGKTRFTRAHKYKDGRIRVSGVCHPCRAANLRKKRVEIKCPTCGIIRILKAVDAKQRLSSFCNSCVKGSYKKRDTSGRHVGMTSRGYAIVYGMKGHPLARSGSILEHWLTVYEQHPMGKESVLWFKKHGFTIHHKNGCRSNNDISNLELRAPGRHGQGWTIDEMEEVIRRYRGTA